MELKFSLYEYEYGNHVIGFQVDCIEKEGIVHVPVQCFCLPVLDGCNCRLKILMLLLPPFIFEPSSLSSIKPGNAVLGL